MKKVEELRFEDLVSLINFLKDLSGTEVEEEQEVFVEENISKFFPYLNAVQEMELFYICRTHDEDAFNIFRSENPEIEIDETGRSIPTERKYWEIKLKALENIYMFAMKDLEENSFVDRSYDKINTQVYNARNLSALKNMDRLRPEMYIYIRKLFLDKHKGDPFINNKTFNLMENNLKEIGIEAPHAFLGNVVEYCDTKRRGEIIFLLEHLFDRIEILKYDTAQEVQENKDFLEGIKTIINKNN
jgi:hypothetical protein